jgi:Flp pilus assembly protein CpaB
VVVVVLPRMLPGGATAEEGPTVPPPPTQPSFTQIIVASQDIRRGATLSVQMVKSMNWPLIAEIPLPSNALVIDEARGLEQVEGRVARVDILADQPVLDHMLSPVDGPFDLGDTGSDAALQIPQGKVAMAFPLTRLSAVAYAIRPGDHVDIMMSFQFVDINEEYQSILPDFGVTISAPPDTGIPVGGEAGPVGYTEDGALGSTLVILPSEPQRARQTTQMVIYDAIVLRVGTFPLVSEYAPLVVLQEATATPAEGEPTPSAEEGPTPIPPPVVPDIVTLILARADALVLKYSMETGARIDLALRSALDDDVAVDPTEAVTLDYIINTYNVTIPPKLPVAQEPRIDSLVQQGEAFVPQALGTPLPSEPEQPVQ